MPTGLTITWTCYNPANKNEFQIVYTYNGQCSAEDAAYTTWGELNGTPVRGFGSTYVYLTEISELYPSSDYKYTIASRQMSGNDYVSVQSDERMFTTSDTAPVSPINVTVNTITDTTATFSWNPVPCTQENGQNFRYDYSLREVLSDTYLSYGITIETSVTLSDITLECNVIYDFNVAAVNDAGESTVGTKDFSLEYVRNVEAMSTAVSLDISWEASDTVCVTDTYLVRIILINQDQCMDTLINIGESETMELSLTHVNLIPYSTYNVEIAPANTAGYGPPFAVDVTTSEIAPSAAPSNVRYTNVSSTSVSFIWDEVACGHRRGNIFQYHCTITSTTDSAYNKEKYAVERTASYEGLQPCTTYDFTVVAVTVAGIGPRTPEARITTEKTKPSPISNLMSLPLDRSTMPLVASTVQWTQSTSGPCQADEYLVEYQLLNIDQCDLVSDSSTEMYDTVTDTDITLTGSSFLPHSAYRVYVTARNSGGVADSENINIQTEDAEPTGSPLTVMVTDVGQRRLSFSWTKPACGERNGDIMMYLYQLTDHHTNNVIMGETSDVIVTINNLTPYVMYSFRIAAINTAGLGPFSDEIVTQTGEDVPPAPEELVAPNTDTTSITIQWLEPDPPHGVITRYHIQYWKTSESMSTAMSAINDGATFTLLGLQPNDEYSFRVQAETSAGRGSWSTTITAEVNERSPSAPSDLRATGIGKTSIVLEWRKPSNPNGIILDYAIKYRVLEKPYDADFIPDDRYITVMIPTTAADSDLQYLVDDLEPSTKYEFRVSGRTSVGRGEEAVIKEYTKIFTDIDPPEAPVLKTSGPSVVIQFDGLPKYISNVYIAVEYALSRKKRQNSNLDGTLNSFIVANLTRSDIGEEMSFTLGDNKTYGGYINHALIPDATYTVRVAYASCTPVAECVVAWSPISIITAPPPPPNCMIDRCGEPRKITNIGATIGGSMGAIVIIVIIIVVIVFYYRRQKSPSQTSPTSNETYDEIDPQIAQQSAVQNETGYEVNLAMEGMQTPKQYEGDELDYEDVNTKRESDYQGLNTGDMETEHDYQGLGETEKKKESDYQGLNKANIDEEHDYQGLGQKSDTNRKTSSPYVNVP
ncbi:receptor-type tyrosine-protein phosphatase F-like [Amphiura filiformis]|uniref:receptor-type tyrosine-protein phosphatase F-like n=1 Tax=Amphiura filiformis TaxID=82378 RepID=UPI003B21D1D6